MSESTCREEGRRARGGLCAARTLAPRPSTIETYGSLAQQVVGLLQYVLPVGAVAVLTGWFAKLSGLLVAYAPFSWAALGLACGVAFALGLALYGVFLDRRSRAKMNDAASARTFSVNPLERTFEKKRISLDDFFSPFMLPNENKHFIECDIVGPSNVIVSGGTMSQCDMSYQCDFIAVNDAAMSRNGVMFHNCVFTRCRFFYVTVLVPHRFKADLEEGFGGRLPWLNDPHPRDPPVAARRKEGDLLRGD